MCGGELHFEPDSTICECEYCGTKQTIPKIDNEKKMTLYERANRLRFNCEFDKAASVYENIIADFHEEAEAYWGLVLCKYGIEYVDDPVTAKKIPTCHRSSFDSLADDADFEMVMEYSDSTSRKVYREEAKTIENIRKSIIEISGKESPYDIFICYKETDENGERTIDSVMAQDIYEQLASKGYRVFFSRISLEDKVGVEYEPYIFAALQSAKIMLAIGTDYDYFNAVWVKNEWSRFLKLMVHDKSKYLIPCFKNIDAFDIPKEFARLQAQDLGKVGAIQDLLRGIDKLIKPNSSITENNDTIKETIPIVVHEGKNSDALLKRGKMALEDKDWINAEKYFDQVLDMNAECGEAYWGLALATAQCSDNEEFSKLYSNGLEELKKNFQIFTKFENNYKRAIQFGGKEFSDLINRLEDYKLEQLEYEKTIRLELEYLREDRLKYSILCNQIITSKGNITLALKSDGKLLISGMASSNQYSNLLTWKDIIMISTSRNHTIGLKSDSTVVSTGFNEYGQCAVSDWSGIIQIACGDNFTIGLKNNGTVVSTGNNQYGQCNISNWSDIIQIACGDYFTLGLKKDGMVVSTGSNKHGPCNVSNWSGIIYIACGADFSLGLRSDGTVVSTGYNESGQCNVSGWHDIISIACGLDHAVAIKEDGKLIATGSNMKKQCNVTDWSDIVFIACNDTNTIGIKKNGLLISTSNAPKSYNFVAYYQHKQSLFGNIENFNNCKLFNNILTLEVERKKAFSDRLKHLRTEKEKLENKLTNLHGIFSFSNRKILEEQLDEVEDEIKVLSNSNL
jgi:hypothetical protein